MSISLATVSCSECGKTVDMIDLQTELDQLAEKTLDFNPPVRWKGKPILNLTVPDGWRWNRHSGFQHCSNKCYGTWLARQQD